MIYTHIHTNLRELLKEGNEKALALLMLATCTEQSPSN